MAAIAPFKTNALAPIRDLLDSHKIRYVTVSYSPTYTHQDIAVDEFSLGYELIEAVLIRLAPTQYAMIVVPVTRKIELASLRIALKNPNIDFLGKSQTQVLFPDYDIGALPPLGCLFDLEVFFAEELYNFQEISFCIQSQSQRIRMSFEDYLSVAQPQKNIEIKTSARYEAQVVTIKPEAGFEDLQAHKTCMLCFSINNQNYTTAKLVGMTEWISQNFSNCQVLMGDLSYQTILEIQGLGEDQALDQAFELSRKVIAEKASIFERHGDICSFDTRFFSDILSEARCQDYYAELLSCFGSDKLFADTVRNFADIFVRRYLEKNSQQFDNSVNRTCTYLLQELAIFAFVAEQDASIYIYPDASSGFQTVAQILHPAIPKPLQKLVQVSLRLRPR